MSATEQQPARFASLRVRSWWARILIGRNPGVTALRLVVVVVVSVVLFKMVLLPVRIMGRSMEPSYRHGRVNFIQQFAYRSREPQRGDVVGIQFEESRLILLKRIVALPGERVAIRDSRVLVNGVPLDEPYAQGNGIPPTQNDVILEADEYFAIGDNRDGSEYGRVRRHEIRGKALF